jgi:hypothetical protein
MRTALLLLLALTAPPFASLALASQTVWKWVDDKGITHYSDRPVPGATKVELSVGSGADSSASSTPPTTSSSPPPAAATGPVYRNFEIWKPQKDEVLVNTGGQVSVNIRVDPALQTGHTLYLYLDGKLVDGFPENTTDYELKEVPRGLHTVVAIINDRRGTRVQDTNRIGFTVRQESIAHPPVGPALRPPPKQRTAAGNKLRTSQPTFAQLNGAHPKIDPRTNAPVVPTAKPKGPKSAP